MSFTEIGVINSHWHWACFSCQRSCLINGLQGPSYSDWCPFSSKCISLFSYDDSAFHSIFLTIVSNCYLRSRVNLMGAVWSSIYIRVFRFILYCFYLILGACSNWRFTAQIQTWPSYQRHRRCTVIQQLNLPCPAAVLLLTPWTDGRWCCRRSRCFLAHIVYAYCCCFTDKFIRRTTRLSFSWPFG